MARIERLSKQDGTVVCELCLIAEHPWSRMKGLLGRSRLEESEGILLSPAAAIHMLFMRFAIDAVFVDRELEVLRVRPGLRPWRFASCRGAHAVAELPAGSCERVRLEPGDRLVLGRRDGP